MKYDRCSHGINVLFSFGASNIGFIHITVCNHCGTPLVKKYDGYVYDLLQRMSKLYNSLGITIKSMIRLCYTINFGLGVFNLIPLPPLDGSKILVAILPEKASEWYRLHQDVLYIVFVIFWITPLSSFFMTYFINFAITPYEALINAIIQIG